MNKCGLISALSKKENLTEKEASEIVGMILKGFSNELLKGGKIEIRGFGSFVVRNYEAYTGINPKTGKKISVAAKRSPFFKVGKELKAKVDNK